MNTAFYEFWGNLFLHLARGQQQMDEMAALIQRGVDAAGDLGTLFRRCYGLQPPSETGVAVDPLLWQRAMTDFQDAFSQFAAQWGWVTQAEHRRSIEKCAALEKRVAEQEATIRQLRDLLTQEGRGHTALFQHLQQSLKTQGEQFHALMESIRGNVGDDAS